MARRVLVVAYDFPPSGGAGVQRTLKLIRYLPDFGWQPIVLTPRSENTSLADPYLESEVPSNTIVRRTSALLLPDWLPWRLRNLIARWLFVVDQELGWFPFAVAQGEDTIRRDGIEAIYTTAPPYTAHLIGLWLKWRSGLSWLADFRDPWVGNFSLNFPTQVHQVVAGRLERRVVRTADRIVVVSEPMRQALLARYSKFINPVQVLTLPNGYDQADFEGVEPLGQDPERLVIVYTGSFYGRRSPLPFLRGVRAALDDGRIPPQGVRIHFVGNVGQTTQEHVRNLGLNHVVQISGYLLHRQSISYLLGADLLLLIIGSGPGSEMVFTGKIFEYLASGKPILALAPPGVAADLLMEAGVGRIVPPDDPDRIAAALVKSFADWRNGQLTVSPDPYLVARYERRGQVEQLARALDEVCS